MSQSSICNDGIPSAIGIDRDHYCPTGCDEGPFVVSTCRIFMCSLRDLVSKSLLILSLNLNYPIRFFSICLALIFVFRSLQCHMIFILYFIWFF